VNQSERELKAIESVSARAGSATKWIGVAIIGPSVLLAFLAYWLIREYSFAEIGVNIPYLSIGIAIFVTVVPAIGIAKGVSRRLVRARRQSWIDDAAASHSVSASAIAEFFGEWNT
jgi:hypothetical protein